MTVYYIIAFLWSIRIIGNILSYIQLWYVKEYRFDRMLIHLRTRQGKNIFFIPFRRPPLSPKTIILFFASFFVLAAVTWIIKSRSIILSFAAADILTFPLISFLVLLLKIPTYLYHYLTIQRAIRLLNNHKNMTVIGITGSYGKTSTKEILFALVQKKYSVLKTQASKNSPIAIAETILSSLRPGHEVFIVEMGAYKQGEIAKMCSMVHPQIAILTAINEQHQDLFGSIESTMNAKYELVKGLTGQKTVIANADNPYIQTMAKWAARDGSDVRLYSLKDTSVQMYATDIKNIPDGVGFTAHYRGKSRNIDVHLFGRHQVSNVLAAMSAALECGMTFDEVCQATEHITPFQKTMYPVKGIRGSEFIDDSFNNNPDAAKAALEFLLTRAGRKILVFQPMIELGAYEKSRHKEVGMTAANICDDIIVTNTNNFEAFLDGVRSVSKTVKVSVMSGHKAAEYLMRILKKGDTVLFKGKEAGRVLALLNK